MVLRQVGEDRGGEVDRVGAMQLESVRGHLHRTGHVAGVKHLAKRALEVDRLGRGSLHGALGAADHALDRAEQTGLAPVGLEQRSHQEGGGRFAIRPRDTHRLQGVCRVAVERGSGGGHGRADALHPYLRDGQVQWPLDDERHGTPGDRLGGKVVPVSAEAGHTEEQRAGRDGACVIREAGDFRLTGARRSAGDDPVESHPRRVPARNDDGGWRRRGRQLTRPSRSTSAADGCSRISPGTSSGRWAASTSRAVIRSSTATTSPHSASLPVSCCW